MTTAMPQPRFGGRQRREILVAIMKKRKLPSIFQAEKVLDQLSDDEALTFLPKEFS